MEISKEWLGKYEAVKSKLRLKFDLDNYFTQKQIGKVNVEVLNIGDVNISSGQIIACDPLVELYNRLPFMQTVPVGRYPLQICVALSEDYGDRYAAVKLCISPNKPAYYECGMVGNEELDDEIDEGDIFGFGVDAGMGCLTDFQAQKAFNAYWDKRLEAESDVDPYNDLFCNLLEENYQKHPKFQREDGDWLNWNIPESQLNIPIFASGWGDGYYPTYFGYDENHNLCGVYILFIDIEDEMSE